MEDLTMFIQENPSPMNENPNKWEKSIVLLKQKMCRSHDLIQQFNDKVKECEKLRTELNITQKDCKKITYNYNSTMAKVIKLELQNNEYKKELNTLRNAVSDHEIATAAHQNHIQQMMHKLEESNNDHTEKIIQYDLEKSSLQMEVEELKLKIKECNKNTKAKQSKKSFGLQVDLQNIPTEKSTEKIHVGTNTNEETVVKIIKPQTTEKYVLTDEFYSLKDDPYPIFCSKCEVPFNSPPIETICKVMTQCPVMIEEEFSSSPVPVLDTNNDEPFKCSDDLSDRILMPPHTSNEKELMPDQSITSQSLELLQKKIDKLERRFNKQKRPVDTTGNMYYQPYWLNPPHYHPYNYFQNPLQKRGLPDPSTQYMYNNIDKSRYNRPRIRNKIKGQSRKIQSLNSSWNVENIQSSFETVQMTNLNHESDNFEFQNDDSHSNEYSSNSKTNSLKNANEFDQSSSVTDNPVVDESSLSIQLLPEKKLESKTNTKEKNVKDVKSQKRGGLLKKLKNLKKITKTVHTNISNGDSLQNCESKNHLTNDTIYSRKSTNRRIAHTRKDSSLNHESSVNYSNDVVMDTTSSRIETPTNIETSKPKKVPIDEIVNERTNTETDSTNIHDSKPQLKRKRGRPRLTDKENSSRIRETDLVTEVKPKRKCTTPLKSQKGSNDASNSSSENNDAQIQLNLNSTPRRGRSLLKNITPTKMNQNTDCNLLSMKTKTNTDVKSYSPNKDLNDQKAGSPITNDMDLLSTCIEDFNHVLPSEPVDIVQNEQSSTSDFECKNDEDMELNRVINISQEIDVPSIDDLSPTLTKSMVEDCDIEAPDETLNSSIENHPTDDGIEATKPNDNNHTHLLPNIINLLQYKKPKPNIIRKVVLKEDMIEKKVKTIATKSQETNEKLIRFSSSMEKEPVTIPTPSLVQEKSITIDDFGGKKLETNATKLQETDEKLIKFSTFNEPTIQISIKKESVITDDLGVGYETKPEVVESISDLVGRYAQEYLDKTRFQKKLPVKQVINVTDDFVQKQLNELLSDDSWEVEFHSSIVNKLSTTCSARVIAKGIVKFLSTSVPWNRVIDKSHTPPAPPMTKAHQRIATLLVDLEKSNPIINIVQDVIEYQLFLLNNTVQVDVIENLVRMFVILARIKKDRERVRIFCCDAMYCLGGKTVNIIYTVLTSWPEVFPYKRRKTDFLSNCLAQLILKTQGGKISKLIPLKNLLSNHYQYKINAYPFENFFKECLEALQENNSTSLMTTVILLAKKNGVSWAYKNIVQAVILPLLINQKFPSVYQGFCLLGDIMRTIPLNDSDGKVTSVVEQLNDLINSGEGSPEQQEGVVTALLSFSRHKFDTVIHTILKWKPLKPLCPRTMEQLKVLVESRPRYFTSRMIKKISIAD